MSDTGLQCKKCSKNLTGRQTLYCSNKCRLAFTRNYAKQNLEARTRRTNLKLKAVLLKGGKCCLCGYGKCLASLEFHHLDPALKDASSNRGMASLPEKKFLAEIEKCILVCANCHREIHYNLTKQEKQTK